ncbi:MAG: hypothetical protein WA825_14515 [Steroidobacteraceae bacterium]
MSFQAYSDNIKAKTGNTPRDVKKVHGLGHGHAMAIYATFERMKEYK